jgi:hypothetical protein
MENALMRADIVKRDYQEECAAWAALACAAENWSCDEERQSIDYALGPGSGANGSKAVSSASGQSFEKEARRGAMETVTRTKKAFACLYQALSDELHRLVACVPQGYAYGLWSRLERKYHSTGQDNVGDLWDEFTRLKHQEDEGFNAYMARSETGVRLTSV